MKLLHKEKKKFVKILIGIGETGKTGISKPIKTLNIESEDTEEVYEELKKMVEK